MADQDLSHRAATIGPVGASRRSLPRPSVIWPLALTVLLLAVTWTGVIPAMGNRAPRRVVEQPPATMIAASSEQVALVLGFVEAVNAGRADRALEVLKPGISWFILPGVVPQSEPTPAELRSSFDQFRQLDGRLDATDCAEAEGNTTSQTLVHCTFRFSNGFVRRLSQKDLSISMTFGVAGGAIDSMFLSPAIVTVSTESTATPG